MDVEIRPEADEEEREAILAALTAEAAEQKSLTPWVRAVLPDRDGEVDEP